MIFLKLEGDIAFGPFFSVSSAAASFFLIFCIVILGTQKSSWFGGLRRKTKILALLPHVAVGFFGVLQLFRFDERNEGEKY